MAGKKNKGRGKKMPNTQLTTPPPSTPPPHGENSPGSNTQSAPNSPLMHVSKKAKTVTDLTLDQEDDMASWLESNEILYNKKITAYKDFRKKDALWESKAESMGKDVDILKTWYRSIRTRYTRLVHKKSGDGVNDLTERDRWVLQNFSWLRVHVVEVKKKTTVSMKDKIAAAQPASDMTPDIPLDQNETESMASCSQKLEPLSSKGSTCITSSKKWIQEEDRLLANVESRNEQSMAFQTKVLEMLAPPKTTERTAYADWTKEVMVTIHPSLWIKFKRECTNMLYTYQEKSEELYNTVSQQPYTSMQYTPQQHHQIYQRSSAGTSSTNPVCHPPPQQWQTGAAMQQTMPVWGTQQPVFTHGHLLTEMQPMTTRARAQPAQSANATSSTPIQSNETSFNLSSFVSDSMNLCDNSIERAVAALDSKDKE